MRATINDNGIEIELVGSPTEIAAVLRDLVGQRSRPELQMVGNAAASSEGEPTDASAGPSESKAAQDVDEAGDVEIVGALTFFKDRKPTNNREATAVAAYYLAEKAPVKDRSPTINKDSLGDVFRQAQWKLPKRLDQTLVDTTSAGYLNRVETGVYEISNTGHNLVIHTLGEK